MKSFILASLITVIAGTAVQNQYHIVKMHPTATRASKGVTVMHHHCPPISAPAARGLIKEASYTPPPDPVPTGILTPQHPNIGEGLGLECGDGSVFRGWVDDMIVGSKGYVAVVLSSAAPAGDYMIVYNGTALIDMKVRVWSNDMESEISVKKGDFHIPVTASRTATFFPSVKLYGEGDEFLFSSAEIYPLKK